MLGSPSLLAFPSAWQDICTYWWGLDHVESVVNTAFSKASYLWCWSINVSFQPSKMILSAPELLLVAVAGHGFGQHLAKPTSQSILVLLFWVNWDTSKILGRQEILFATLGYTNPLPKNQFGQWQLGVNKNSNQWNSIKPDFNHIWQRRELSTRWAQARYLHLVYYKMWTWAKHVWQVFLYQTG